MKIVNYELHRLFLKLRMPIGDSQVRFTEHWMTVVELETDNGRKGVGFEIQQGMPTPALAQLRQQFEYNQWPTLADCEPCSRVLRITRPRGGNVGAAVLALATETALWDLSAKAVNLPLYRLFGGTDPQVKAYGSTLDFRLDDDQFRSRLGEFRDMGFRGIKVKVGHPDVQWDLRRLQIVREVMGENVDLMIDANEAWTPKEAILRAHEYDRAGVNIYWIEDPITREDYEGYARVAAEIPFTRINTGEYLGFAGKRRLLESRGVDVLNIHGAMNMSRAAAHLAGDFGIPVSLGNTVFETGVHLAASLPECLYLEYSDLAWNQLAKEPVRFEASYACAPDRPGHGIEFDPQALQEFSRPE